MPYSVFWMLCSGILLSFGVIASKLAAGPPASFVWLSTAFLSYALSYGLFYYVLRVIPVSIASPTIQAVSILSTAVIASLYLGELLSLGHTIAYGLILTGLGILIVL